VCYIGFCEWEKVMQHIAIDDEELEHIIDFHLWMAKDADESGEHEEAKQRRCRAKSLRALLNKRAA
jgi:hypothetical protein